MPIKKQPPIPKFNKPKHSLNINSNQSKANGTFTLPPLPDKPPNLGKTSPRQNGPPVPKKTPPLPPPKRSKYHSLQPKTPSPNQSNSNSPDFNNNELRKSFPMPSRPPPQVPLSPRQDEFRNSDLNMTVSESDSEYESEESTQYYFTKSKTSDIESSDNESEHQIRTNIANEILSTERTYVNLLEKLTTIWFEPIKNQNPNDPIIPLDISKSLFSNLEIIFHINSFLMHWKLQ